jgi:hypothetical protein
MVISVLSSIASTKPSPSARNGGHAAGRRHGSFFTLSKRKGLSHLSGSKAQDRAIDDFT